MKTLAIALGGTDGGVSGIGRYVGAVLPRLRARAERSGVRLVALGTRAELGAYTEALRGIGTQQIPDACDSPAVSALWHLGFADAAARRAGADTLLLPAANRRATLVRGLRTVAVVHDLAQLHVARKYDVARMTYVRWVLRGALRAADVLVAVSGATRTDLVRIGCDEARMRVVHNGVDVVAFGDATRAQARAAAARERFALREPYLLYPARLEHPGKNHARLLAAFASSAVLAKHQLVLTGKDWGALALIRSETQRLGLEARVRLLGHVDDEALYGLLAGADAVAVLGLHEGFGLPALEALAAARPVVASSTGALREVAGPLAAYCDPFQVDSIARALERAVTDAALRQRVADEGPARAASFGWERTADGLFDACLGRAA